MLIHINCLTPYCTSKINTQTSPFYISFGFHRILLKFFRLTFDWKTPLGYLIAVLLELASTTFASFIILPIVCLVIGSCHLITSFIRTITKNDFHILNDRISNEVHLGMNAQICSFMRDFSEIKQLNSTFLSYKYVELAIYIKSLVDLF